MGYHALSCLSQETDSGRAGLAVARALREGFGAQKLKAVLIYATVNHDQGALLRGLREGMGPGVIVVGGSGQGVMTNGAVLEGGFVVGAMGLGGDGLAVAGACAERIDADPLAAGRQLADRVRVPMGGDPKLLLLVYDPLNGVDVDQLLAGLKPVGCPIVGGAASQPSGPIEGTFQYHGDRALQRGAVVLGLSGSFHVDLDVSHGTSPTGIFMTLTRAEGNKLLELDGRPALDVWRECVGCEDWEILNQDSTAALAMGIERRIVHEGSDRTVYMIRAAFGFDRARKAVVVQAAIPEGSKIMFHHRTVKMVKEGSVAMGNALRAKLEGKRPWAVLGFECGARTAPFLGPAETLAENLSLQRTVAPLAPWLGLLSWGEIAPCGGEPEFHNYTYPLVVLSQ
jgi:hypothetical protein